MAFALFELLVILSAAILVVSFVRCIISHDTDHKFNMKRGANIVIPPDSSIRIDVYYEAFDGNSESFIIQQLIPTYESIKDATDIILVPYGKTKMSPNSNGTYEMQCEHGPIQCEANMQHACIVENIQDVQLKLFLIGCMLSYNDATEPWEAFLKCSHEQQMPQNKLIEACVKSGDGMKLLQRNGQQTLAFSERYLQIPFMIINEYMELEANHTGNLLFDICKLIGNSGKLRQICAEFN